MPAIHANPGRFHFRSSKGDWGVFRPVGKLEKHGKTRNPPGWDSEETYAARIFVGFNVGEQPVWTIDDLMRLVKEVREEQVGVPDSSFIAQRGIYKHTSGELKGTVVEEDGAQVIIIDMSQSKRHFVEEMMNLADIICARFEQESVILEIQRNGVMEKVYGMYATEAPPVLRRAKR